MLSREHLSDQAAELERKAGSLKKLLTSLTELPPAVAAELYVQMGKLTSKLGRLTSAVKDAGKG